MTTAMRSVEAEKTLTSAMNGSAPTGVAAKHVVSVFSSIDSWDVLLVLGVGMLFAGLLLVFGVGYALIGCGSLFVVGGLMGARGKQLAATNDSEVS